MSGAPARDLAPSVVALCGETCGDMYSKEFEVLTQRGFMDGICGSSGIDFRCLLKESTEVKGRSLALDGRLFHSLGAAMLKAL